MPQISVIVPVYKVEPYLHRCIDSILSQTFTDFELILVDDGSPDNSGAICDAYAIKDSRIRVIHQQNGGPSAARNAGLDHAFACSDSEWITFIDSDDWVHPQTLELSMRALSEYGTSAVTYNNMWGSEYVAPEELDYSRIQKISVDMGDTHNNLYQYYFNQRYRDYITCGLYAVYSKECFDSIRFREDVYFAEDIEMIARLNYRANSIVHLDVQLYYYYDQSVSLTRSPISVKRLSHLTAKRYLLAFLKANGYADYDKFQYRYIWLFFDLMQKAKSAADDSVSDAFCGYEETFREAVNALLENPYLSVEEKLMLLLFKAKISIWYKLWGHSECRMLEKIKSFIT